MQAAGEKVEVTGHWDKIGAQDLGFEAEAQKKGREMEQGKHAP